MLQTEILPVIIDSMGRLNEQLPEKDRLPLTGEAAIWGDASNLDSLSLINLIVDVEESLHSRLGRRLDILEAGVMSPGTPQFSTAEELSRWVADRLARP